MNYQPLFFLLLASALPAQQYDPVFLPWLGSPGAPGERGDPASAVRPLAPTVTLNHTAGLQLLDGELWGGADGYKVLFTAEGFQFTPVLGAAAPRNYPLAFRMESCGRGGEFAPVAAGQRRHEGLRVEYDRGNVVERYDVGTTALEQSFVFARRPTGHGDLVVRGQLQTDMVVTAENGGLRIEQPGIGGFHIGAVTGIDANGVRVSGTVRYASGMLELSLPAEFVDRAALPFVLDPPIGSAFLVTPATAPSDCCPDAAFDVSNGCYLVVWERIVSSTDHDIVGQRILSSGSFLGGLVMIDVAANTLASDPSVANCNGPNAFVAVYTSGYTILGRSVNAATAVVSSGIVIASGASVRHPSIGGDRVLAVPVSGNCVCVWETGLNSSLVDPSAVHARRVIVNVDLSLAISATVHTLMQGTTAIVGRARRPSISKSGSTAGRYAVVCDREFGPSNFDPWAIVVNSTGAPLTPPVALDSGPAQSIQARVDGDGTSWVTAWQNNSGFTAAAMKCGITLAGSPLAIVAGPVLNVAPASNGDQHAAVIWTGLSTLVVTAQLTSATLGSPSRTVVHSVDPLFQCSPCEGAFPITLSSVHDQTPSGCSATSAAGPVDEALVVWTSAPPVGTSDIAGMFWRSADGTVTSVQGGCGLGGLALATCARVGNPDFTHRLRGSTPLALSVLIQSLSQGSVTCNTCTLAPSLTGSVWTLFVTDALGNVAFPSAIPNNPALSGFVLFEQWLTLRPGGACSAFDVDLSNALRIVIE